VLRKKKKQRRGRGRCTTIYLKPRVIFLISRFLWDAKKKMMGCRKKQNNYGAQKATIKRNAIK